MSRARPLLILGIAIGLEPQLSTTAMLFAAAASLATVLLFGLVPANASRFLAQRGLRTTSHVGPADLERLYLTTQHNSPLGRTLGHVRIIAGQA